MSSLAPAGHEEECNGQASPCLDRHHPGSPYSTLSGPHFSQAVQQVHPASQPQFSPQLQPFSHLGQTIVIKAAAWNAMPWMGTWRTMSSRVTESSTHPRPATIMILPLDLVNRVQENNECVFWQFSLLERDYMPSETCCVSEAGDPRGRHADPNARFFSASQTRSQHRSYNALSFLYKRCNVCIGGQEWSQTMKVGHRASARQCRDDCVR